MGAYTLVGNIPSWIVAFMPVPALVACYVTLKVMGRSGWFRPWIWATFVAWFFITSLAGLPSEWIFSGALLGLALTFCVTVFRLRKRAETPVIASIMVGLALFGLVAITGMAIDSAGLAARMQHERITIDGDKLTYNDLLGSGTISRRQLRVQAFGPHKAWWNIHSWTSWTVDSANDYGPDVSGIFVYWGPDGLIQGDALGQRIANWAAADSKHLALR